jgi:hypothetical protein
VEKKESCSFMIIELVIAYQPLDFVFSSLVALAFHEIRGVGEKNEKKNTSRGVKFLIIKIDMVVK